MKNTIITHLKKSVMSFPDKICLVDDKSRLTYKQLGINTNRVATYFIENNLFHVPIVVFINKSINCLTGMLGIAQSGNFYTPIDTKMPISRVNTILETLQPACIVTDHDNYERIFNLCANSIKVVLIQDILQTDENLNLINEIEKKIIDTDILYVLFTSGSTGVPKGVTINHRSVIEYIEWVTETFHLTEREIIGNQAPFYFDNSILDIFCSIKNGCTLYLIPESLFSFPLKLLEYLEDNQINFIFWVPSALNLIANLKALDKFSLTHLKKVLFCGEPMHNKQLNYWRNHLPHILYANLYGPTEITDVCSYYIVDRLFTDEEPLPIGRACINVDIFLLDEQNQLVTEQNTIGELCVRGTSLAMGYYSNPQKTREVFVQNPLHDNYPEIIYRTGDLAKYNNYCELIYISRKDFQIKYMGHRIELGEIESAVNSFEEVFNCCCLYNENENKLILFYTSTNEINDVDQRLKKMLPHYMIPHRKIRLESMPLNHNGKIDRVVLKDYFLRRNG